MSTFHPETTTVLKYVLDEQRRDLATYQNLLEQADETSLKTAVERERFPGIVAGIRTHIAALTAVVADFVELLRLIEQGNADEQQAAAIREALAGVAL